MDSKYFKYMILLDKQSDGFHIQTTAPHYSYSHIVNRGGFRIRDYSNAPDDNLAQLGDIANDRYHSIFLSEKQPAPSGTPLYVGKIGGKGGFVGREGYAPGQYYYFLYTNKAAFAKKSARGELLDVQSSPYALCFAADTRIRVARGADIVDVPVQDLVLGDLAVTASGAQRPIKWLGHRRMDCRKHPRPAEANPIHIAAHAFGTNRPARDLHVSPGHAICIDVGGEVLIPASALVNGTTIRQVAADEVTYWHVELDTHDILIAEGLAAESYMDMGNREFFAESAIVAFDVTPDARPSRRESVMANKTHADFCRPFHDRGPVVEAVRNRLAARAARIGAPGMAAARTAVA